MQESKSSSEIKDYANLVINNKNRAEEEIQIFESRIQSLQHLIDYPTMAGYNDSAGEFIAPSRGDYWSSYVWTHESTMENSIEKFNLILKDFIDLCNALDDYILIEEDRSSKEAITSKYDVLLENLKNKRSMLKTYLKSSEVLAENYEESKKKENELLQDWVDIAASTKEESTVEFLEEDEGETSLTNLGSIFKDLSKSISSIDSALEQDARSHIFDLEKTKMEKEKQKAEEIAKKAREEAEKAKEEAKKAKEEIQKTQKSMEILRQSTTEQLEKLSMSAVDKLDMIVEEEEAVEKSPEQIAKEKSDAAFKKAQAEYRNEVKKVQEHINNRKRAKEALKIPPKHIKVTDEYLKEKYVSMKNEVGKTQKITYTKDLKQDIKKLKPLIKTLEKNQDKINKSKKQIEALITECQKQEKYPQAPRRDEFKEKQQEVELKQAPPLPSGGPPAPSGGPPVPGSGPVTSSARKKQEIDLTKSVNLLKTSIHLKCPSQDLG